MDSSGVIAHLGGGEHVRCQGMAGCESWHMKEGRGGPPGDGELKRGSFLFVVGGGSGDIIV